MGDQIAASMAELKAKLDRQEEMERKHGETCSALTQALQHLRALEVYLEQAQQDLKNLDGLSLTGLLYALTGRKGQAVEKARHEYASLSTEYKAYTRKIEALEIDISKLEKALDEIGDVRGLYQAGLQERQAAVESSRGAAADKLQDLRKKKADLERLVNALAKALHAGEEALKDLRDEVHVMGSMGRIRVAEGHGLIRAAVNSARKGAVEECAARVRATVRRFRSRLADALGAGCADAELADLDATLAGLAGEVRSGKWEVKTVDYDTTDEVDQRLQFANQLVEKKLVEAKREFQQIDARIKQTLEGE